MSRAFIEGKLLALSLLYIIVGGGIYSLSANIALWQYGVLPLSSVFALILLGVGLMSIAFRTYSVLYAASFILGIVVCSGVMLVEASWFENISVLLSMFVVFWLASLVLAAVFSAVEKRITPPYVDVNIEKTVDIEKIGVAPEANKARVFKRGALA